MTLRVYYAPWPHDDKVQAAARAAGANMILDGQGGYAEIAEPGDTLAEQLELKIKALQERRTAAILAFHVFFQGQDVHIPLTLETQTDIAHTYEGLKRQPDGSTVSWEVVDGVYVPVNLASIEALGDASFAWVQACFSNSEKITATLKSARDLETLKAVDLDSGWPT